MRVNGEKVKSVKDISMFLKKKNCNKMLKVRLALCLFMYRKKVRLERINVISTYLHALTDTWSDKALPRKALFMFQSVPVDSMAHQPHLRRHLLLRPRRAHPCLQARQPTSSGTKLESIRV